MADVVVARAVAKFCELDPVRSEDDEHMRVLSALLGCLIVAETSALGPALPGVAQPRRAIPADA